MPSFSKNWANWAAFTEARFHETKGTDLKLAVDAIAAYMQAAAHSKNGRTKKFLARILWLLSFDDANGTLCLQLDSPGLEGGGASPLIPTWYWIPFIPQLLVSLNRSDATFARSVLLRISKDYPQVSLIPRFTLHP
jgi:transformation/transcription domain-associated protein